MRKVVLIDGDILTPLGDLRTTWDYMLSGKSGVVCQEFGSMTGRYSLAMIEDLQGTCSSWARLQQIFDRLFINLPPLSEKTMVFCATTKAAVDELLQGKNVLYGQPWQIADYLNNRFDLAGSGTSVSGACASGNLAIIQGAMAIATGACNHALIVGFDMVTEFTLSGFDCLKALSPDGARPFDIRRNGLSLGDGAGWILLASDDSLYPGDTIMAYLDSWGISCDAAHITAPCPKASGLIAAIDQIMARTSLPIGGINAHGTGTVHNDAMELLAFDQRIGPGIPVCSVKGALGHSLGAAGVVETLLSTMSIHYNILPPTVGLVIPEKTGCVLSGVEPLPLQSPSVLTCNSGFGGINAALFLTR